MGFSEHGKKISGSINCWKFLDWLKSHSFLRRTLFYEINNELEINIIF